MSKLIVHGLISICYYVCPQILLYNITVNKIRITGHIGPYMSKIKLMYNERVEYYIIYELMFITVVRSRAHVCH